MTSRCCCRSPGAWTSTSALIMFAGIYYGGMYGGSTTSILLNTPGESASVVTAIEGNKMAKAGRAAQALATAAIGSLRRRHHRDAAARAAGADGRRPGRAVLARRLLRGHAARLHRGDVGARQLPGPRARLARPRPDHRPDRHRPDLGPAAAHLRHPAARRRHRRRRRRGRAVRGRRGAVDGGPPAPQPGRGHPGRQPADEPRRTGAAPGSRGCAAP